MATEARIAGLTALFFSWTFVLSTVHAESGGREPCIFDDYTVLAVAPLHDNVNVGYGSYQRLHGAQLYLLASDGLTAEWLTLSVQRSFLTHARTGGSQACRPACHTR
jgi:hypothetical protein